MRFVAFAILLGFLAQDKKKDDVIQLRDGSIKVGHITKVDDTGLDMILNKESKSTRFEFKEIEPYYVYRVKSDRIDKESGKAHFELGEFCQSNGLFSYAIREFEDAVAKDKSLSEKSRKKVEECRNEDARMKFEEAKRLASEKRYRDANELLSSIIDKYADSPHFEEAKKLIAQITEAVQKENDEKKKQLEEKKKAEEGKVAKSKEDQEKLMLTVSIEAFEDAQKSWADGLDWEGKGNLTKADKAWKTSEAKILAAKKNTELLSKSNDVEMIKKAKDLDKGLDAWLTKTYYRLGRMWAVELNYPVALDYFNKALRMPHDDQMDHLVNEMLLTLSQLQMRKRAAGGGY